MQTMLDNRSKIISNMGAVKNSSEIVASMINAGILKPKNVEETVTEINFLRNKFIEWNTEGLSEEAHTTPTNANKEFKGVDKGERNNCTEGQRKAIWAIIYGNNGNKELESELPKDINNFNLKELTFDFASSFLDKHGRK